MSCEILIVTKPKDEHAYAIATGLEMMGVQPRLFRFCMMPYYQRHTFELGSSATLSVDDVVLADDLTKYDRIWLRRIGSSSVGLLDVDPKDERYVSRIITQYRHSLFAFMDRFCLHDRDAIVNSYASKIPAESKILQLWEARNAGLKVPDTLQSNDYDAIARFQAKHGDRIICKPIVPRMWYADKRMAFSYTTTMPPLDTIPRDALELHPALYQPNIDKAFEARVTIFGGRQFGIKIDSQSNSGSKTDWRTKKLFKNGSEPYHLPDGTFRACLDLMARLDIKYGAFDFIITPDGEHIFLEVNEAGQFLFVEDCAPQEKVAHAFCHFLIHGNLRDWNESAVTFSLADLLTSQAYLDRRSADGQLRDYGLDSMISPFDDSVGILHPAA